MDEDQVNEEQGNDPERQEVTFKQPEQDETPSRGMFSAVRRADPVNLYTFLGKQNDDVNERITVLESNLGSLRRDFNQEQSASQTRDIANLTRINSSLLTLEQGLKVVSDKLELSAQLEKIRDANNLKREQQLAEQQLRAGKESLVEKRMQTALAAPLQKIGGKARSILGGLLKFFNTILLGIIGTRGIQVISALLSGNTEKIEEIKGKILKELGIASGIFLAINGGLAIALRSVVRLTAFIGRVAFTNLLARPLRRIFDLASRGAFLRGTTGGRTVVPPPTTVQPGKNRQPQNLIPRITQSITNKIDNLFIYGNDYNTRDGTCVRDYIHVMDVAESHVYALKQLINSKDLIYDDFNVGTGEGKSVLEIINCFENTNKLDINFSYSQRRAGDVESIYADVSKINKQLNWYSKHKIEDALKSAWMWQEKLNKQ